MNEEPTLFPKQIKIDDYEPPLEGNILRVIETSNMLLGNGGRTTSTAIIMAKALHFMQDEGTINLQGKQLLELGSGVGLLGLYLGCLGSNVILSDLPSIKDMTERNINLNRDLFKGEVEFAVINWKKSRKAENKMAEKEEGVSTSSSDLSNLKCLEQLDLTVTCETGGIKDLQLQLEWLGKEGMITGFMEKNYQSEDHLNCQQLQHFLVVHDYEFELMEGYHPDYSDTRVKIYKIWK